MEDAVGGVSDLLHHVRDTAKFMRNLASRFERGARRNSSRMDIFMPLIALKNVSARNNSSTRFASKYSRSASSLMPQQRIEITTFVNFANERILRALGI